MAIAIFGGVAAIMILFIVIAQRPQEFAVTRSATMAAPAAAIFPHVNELRKWEAWSPWAKLDPNAKSTFEGPAAGTGACMRWEGNNKVGAGSMTIVESRPNELVGFRLDFLKPMKVTQAAEFSFKPEGGQTVVTWTMRGKNNFMGKAMGLFIDCDKMIGQHFEKGLADLKALAEGSHKS